MKIEFAGLNTSGKVEMVWCLINIGKSQSYPGMVGDHIRDYLIVWGRRGGKLQSKVLFGFSQINLNQNIFNPEFRENMWGSYQLTYGSGLAVAKRIFDIINKGYVPIKVNSLEEIDPNLPEQLNKLVFWETMKL